MVNVFFAKVRPGAAIPSKREEDAGYDVFLALERDFERLGPMETRLLPAGIASAVEPGYYFQLQERGSTGSRGIARRCGVIDSGYRGEWFVTLTNLNAVPLYFAKPPMRGYFEGLAEKEDFIVYYTDRAVCQAVLLPVPRTSVTEVSYDELRAMTSERMDGCLGSSEKQSGSGGHAAPDRS